MNREEIKFNCIIEMVKRGEALRDAKRKVYDLSIEEIKNLIGEVKIC
tara:strand:+ start:213 stop:353 length:141 start_codon:yes stop_codon:yes gene_type:complete